MQEEGGEVLDLVPARMISEYVYCPRLALIALLPCRGFPGRNSPYNGLMDLGPAEGRGSRCIDAIGRPYVH